MRLPVVVLLLGLTACTPQVAGPEPREVAPPTVEVERVRAEESELVLASRYPPRLLAERDGRWTDVTPEGLAVDSVLHDVDAAAGRTWVVEGDCAMSRVTAWTSDDAGRSWDRHEVPAGAHCSAGSGLRLRDVGEESAVLEVEWGAVQEIYTLATRDGGRTWKRGACRSSVRDEPCGG